MAYLRQHAFRVQRIIAYLAAMSPCSCSSRSRSESESSTCACHFVSKPTCLATSSVRHVVSSVSTMLRVIQHWRLSSACHREPSQPKFSRKHRAAAGKIVLPAFHFSPECLPFSCTYDLYAAIAPCNHVSINTTGLTGWSVQARIQ